MNITGKYLKAWKIERKENFQLVDLGDSRKQKDGSYLNWTWFKTAFVGEAARKEIAEKDTIEITSGQISQEKYNDKWYTKVVVFDFNVMQRETGDYKPKEDTNHKQPFNDDSIPF